jgi:hypothetical protein
MSSAMPWRKTCPMPHRSQFLSEWVWQRMSRTALCDVRDLAADRLQVGATLPTGAQQRGEVAASALAPQDDAEEAV